jgi:hypothetical protein
MKEPPGVKEAFESLTGSIVGLQGEVQILKLPLVWSACITTERTATSANRRMSSQSRGRPFETEV